MFRNVLNFYSFLMFCSNDVAFLMSSAVPLFNVIPSLMKYVQ